MPVSIKIVPPSLPTFLTISSPDIYTAARTLHGMASDGQAPAFFRKTVGAKSLGGWMKGVPMYAVGASSMFIILGYMNATKSATVVFLYLVSVTTVLGALNWVNIHLSYFGMLRAMKAQGKDRKDMKYRGPLQPYATYCAFALTTVIIVFNGEHSPHLNASG
jgi:amino acid transporter